MFADIINTDKNITMISPLLHHLPSTPVPVKKSPFAFLQWEIAPQTCAQKCREKHQSLRKGFSSSQDLPRMWYTLRLQFSWRKYEEIMIRLLELEYPIGGFFLSKCQNVAKVDRRFSRVTNCMGPSWPLPTCDKLT